ncbi:alanine dehydrogenase [Propionibacteriaceae bacterium G1746]|uniref:alanine dehydrogenase n=1 Tax=Aestuariimicrobium sp. G57 TaxID=3418485 RepID=UPI003C16EC9B
MRVGVPREVKDQELRVALTPVGARVLVAHGHSVVVESGAGAGSRFSDEEYAAAGAQVVAGAGQVWDEAELVLKVKEPVESEYGLVRPGLTLFTYLHLAANPGLTRALLDSGVTSLAYETVQLPDRSLPLLAPMSEIAGRLAPTIGSYHLLSPQGGRGVLLGGVPGVAPADVVILGGGVAGRRAAEMALGLRANVTVLDINLATLRAIDQQFHGQVKTVASNLVAVTEAVVKADLVIGAVLVPGAATPKLVTNDDVAQMREGSVLVDIAVDQGGCFTDSHPTTHSDPTFRVHNSLFYCVTNMPGAVPRTSTAALTNATLPYALALADKGWRMACAGDPALAAGLSTHAGVLTNEAVAAAQGLESRAADEVLRAG